MAVTLIFGKHRGKTVEWLFFNDPGYVYWMFEEGIHEENRKFTGTQQEFAALLRRAAHIRLPGSCSRCKRNPATRMLFTVHTSGGLARVDFDCDECAPEERKSFEANPGFWTPDVFRNYDKTGGRILVRAIKHAMFGDSSYKMTPGRIGEFWSNPTNFVDF